MELVHSERKPPKLERIKHIDKAGDVAQGYSACIACMRLCVQSLTLETNNQTNRQTNKK
jgi:hypothetical protein